MPESGSESTNTPGSELASEVGSLRRFNATSDAGSAIMSRSYSDQPSMRSYEESSVSAKGPGATINRKIGENLSNTLREHFSPSPAAAPSPSQHHDDVLSVVEHRGAPGPPSDHEASPSASIQHAEPGPTGEAAAAVDSAALRPFSYSNASVESSSSPIMKMQPPSITTPSLRDFPINADHNPSFESVHAPIRQRTDSRPTISPTNTSRAISTPAPMPLPQALQDLRPTVRRAQGQRAESEVVRSRNSSKPFIFPSRSSAQFTPQERDRVLQTKSAQSKNGESFIRRLIRRASLKGNKSQSVGGTPSLVLSPGKTSIALPSELEVEDSSAVTTPRAESFSSRGTKESKPRNSLTRRRSKSKDTGSTKTSKTSSIFAPFLARDPNKSSGIFRTRRADSFGHLGPLPLDDAPPFPRDGLPLSSSSPFLARDPDFAGFGGASEDGVRSRDFAIVRGTKQTSRSSPDQQEAAELLESPEMKQAEELDPADGEKQRPLSHMTDQTDNSFGMGMPPSSGSNFNFQESLSLNELSAAATQRSDATNLETGSYGRNELPLSSNGHSSVTEGHARPRAGIPRIWQGLEPIDGDNTMRSTHIDDADSSDDTPSDHNVPANRFDTATTTSSFKTAMSNLDSPKSASTRRQNIGSRASRVSLRTLDTPLARHFDQGTRQDSPLADLITNLERRISFHSNSGTMGSAPYQDATASPSSECLHLEADDARPAIAAGPSPSPSLNGHEGQLYHDDYHDEDDDASIRALPREAHLPVASHTALVETMCHSNRNSLVEPTPNLSQEVVDSRESENHWYKRDTFGGLDSIPLAAVGSQQSGPIADAARPQISRFSTATAGPEDEDHPTDHVEGDDTEEQEVVLPEVKVSEIESHLAAVEAALQDNRDEGSFDPTSLRQRMSDASYVLHANTSSASMLSRDGSLQPVQHPVDKSTDDLSLPGAWTQDSSSFIMSDDGRRITLAPESHEALADAVRSVRKAISSSQLTDAEESRTAIASRSVDTLGMESFVSDVAEPASERMPAGEMSMMSEATPARAARRRQEGMRDIEEAYSRMLALVQSSAIGVTPSPQMRAEEGRLGLEPPRRPMKHGQTLSGGNEPFFNSPLAKSSTKTDEPLSQPAQPKRNTFDGANISQSGRPQARAQSIGETRTSTSLSGLMGMPLDINPQMLRHASVSSVSSAQDISRNESVEGGPIRRRPPSDAKSSSSRYSQALSRDHVPSSLIDSDGFRKRFSTDNTTVGRASSGGGHTSPSATAKTLGTPRSFATSVSQHSLANMVRRHELEKESLLDTLERVRAENADLHARHDSLTSDLHAEVTRVLELERELERRDSREVTLIGQIQDLENELMELRYLDNQLNSTADQTLGSEDGEGSIMDVELPPTFHSTSRMGTGAFSPRVKADQMVSPPPSFSSASVSALARPTHRSTRSEAFVSGLPGSERSTLPTSRSELPRARPVSLLNGPGGLFREDGGSVRSSQASPLPAPRSSSLLRVHRGSTKAARAQQASSTLLGFSLPKEEDEMWSIADEQLPEIEDELVPGTTSRSNHQVPSFSAKGETFDSTLVNSGHHDGSYEDEGDHNSSVPSTIQHKNASTISNNGGTPLRDSSSSSIPRSTSQATVTKSTSTSTQLARPSPVPSKIPTSRSVSGISDSPSHRSISSRLPRLGLKPSTRYSTSGSGIRSISGATDKSTGSTLSSVYSNMSAGAPPSLGSLPSGNNTMEDEIQAELARLGNPQPYMRYYSPPRSKMI
ncbi:uncharacterized protein UTRI_00725_B [Ustilago trichophora]|uniref:Uncharacterized protein n=1 Tax=Ustilago trichophora TaxID=86804 RepID=A0A5C3DSZ0_9BASI|nr:uncharacterized protein UTRI_00725_B [Ustilago trichophora]